MTPLMAAMSARPAEFGRRRSLIGPVGGRSGDFTRVATGSALRPFALIGFQADESVVTGLREQLESKRPSDFLPLPPARGRPNAWIDIWVADADRVACVLVAPAASRREQARQPVHVLDGAAYDALVVAHADGRLQVSEELSELQTSSETSGGGNERAEFRYDVQLASTLITRARRRFATSLVVAALGALLTIWSVSDNERLGFVVPGIVALIAGTAFAMVSRAAHRRSRDSFGTLTGRLVSVDGEGISFESLPGVPWSQVMTVAVHDRRRVTGETTDRPHRDWGEAIGHDVRRGSGAGDVSFSMVLADGAAAQAAVVSPAVAGFVKLGPEKNGHRPAQILMTPDSVISLDETARFIRVVSDQAVAHSIPMVVTTDPGEFQGAVLDALGGRPGGNR